MIDQIANALTDDAQCRKMLVEGLEQIAPGLAGVRDHEQQFPTRREVGSELRQIELAAKRLARLQNSSVSDTVLYALAFETENVGLRVGQYFFDVLDTISRNVEINARRVRAGKGGDRFVGNTDGLTARELCALIVIEAYCITKGRDPGARNSNVIAWAEQFWIAAGGREMGKPGTHSLSGWERHFLSVKRRLKNGELTVERKRLNVSRS